MAQMAQNKPGRRIRRLNRTELPIDTAEMARYLIGKMLVHDLPGGRVSGRIVETEAYVIGDAAGHAFQGLTRRNRSLFLDRGHAYVHLAYGIHILVNISTEIRGVGAGVLLRALEPFDGISFMEHRRDHAAILDLARGPGRLARAMCVDLRSDGVDLCAQGLLWLGDSIRPTGELGTSVRIGVSREAQRLLRFYERNNPFVSGPKRMRV